MKVSERSERLQENLTVERLKEVVSYDPITGDFRWISPTSNRVKSGDIAGAISHGYTLIRIDGFLWRAHRLAWLYVYGTWPKNDVDHMDLNKSNNAIANLREATRSQNNSNSKPPKNNVSGYKGVSPFEGKWRARIKYNQVEHHLGLFDDPHSAHAAYVKAAKKFQGEFARTN